MSMINIPYSDMLPLAQLHWLIADRTGAITVEATADGLHVYENPVGVLTNNPPLPLQMFHLNNFRALSPRTPESTFAPGLQLDDYSRGLGGLGLPGDLSAQSRFVRAAFCAHETPAARTQRLHASASSFTCWALWSSSAAAVS